MIIPIRCMGCGNVISALYRKYQADIENIKRTNPGIETNKYILDTNNIPVTAEKLALDNLELRRICCRNHMLTHIDLLQKV